MPLNNAKHIVSEIDGVRCTIIETGITIDRAAFLRQLLEFNNFVVKEMQVPSAVEGEETKYTIGVTDLIFNPVFAVYECLLKTPEGNYVTPGYWKQECTDCDTRYWMRRKSAKQI
jgi:hypothetical protein